MASVVKLQQLGQTMEEGTIVRCLVSVGDEVTVGQVLYEVETDKATIEMESPARGFVKKLMVEAGQTVPVHAPMMILGEKDEAVSQETINSLVGSGGAATATQPVAAEQSAPAATAGQAPQGVEIVKLQQLGQTMEEGTVVHCHVNLGDQVQRGQVLFDIETDKATIEMESPAEGFVKAVLVETGKTIPVDAPMLVLAPKDQEVSAAYIESLKGGKAPAPAAQPAVAAAAPVAVPAPTAAPVPVSSSAAGRTFASPRAIAAAKQLGVNIKDVRGSGPMGRIVEADVRTATPASKGGAAKAAVVMAPPAHKLGESIEVNKLQKIIAQRMVQSKREIPCFYLNLRADMTELVKFREQLNKRENVKVSFNDFIVKAMAMALKQFPIMTGQLAGDRIQLASSIGIGLAISVEDGLVAPILKDVAEKSILQVAAESKSLIERTKAGKLSPSDLEGGCMTLSNLGAFGIESFIPIVVPGQCSILGVGKIAEAVVPEDGNLMVRKMMSLTLAVDHKVANGAYAAQFLDYVHKLLENTATFE